MIPPPEYFSHLYEYVKWADLRQLDAARSIIDEEYFKDRGWSFGNIHKIMLHELAAQNTWLQRFEGQKVVWLFDEPRMAARSSIEPEWTSIHQRFTNFLKKQSPQSLAASIGYINLRNESFVIPLWQLLVHVTNHATHHRGQLNSMIRLAGGKPLSTDYQAYAIAINPR
ncbi:MAG TPA: DinB family protein [Tepidisphaeraceae bacterium]|nr:DinB family protein [Tepidisphaeraceae bacterium]